MFTRQETRSDSTRARWRGALVLAALVAATTVLGLAQAGNLEPPGPPGPTMKTLDEIPPTWSQLLPSDDGDADGCNSSRFRCVGPSGDWVLDLQTGLVWMRNIGISSPGFDWAFARTCVFFEDGGWRLATPVELGTLRARGVAADNLGMPVGHPFLIPPATSLDVWTMTSSADDPTQAWFYRFDDQSGSIFPQEAPKTALKQRWCVRTPSPGLALY